jgi:quercetin dioxygenase-like cupin family protein
MRRVMVQVAIAVMLVGLGYAAGRAEERGLTSSIMPAAKATVAESGDWGEFHAYYEGATAATPAMLVGYADIRPGHEIHPPHTHADEEFLYLAEGSGTWTLGEKTSPATAGDVLYSAPNVRHGITNTSDKPLRFVVVKWKAK